MFKARIPRSHTLSVQRFRPKIQRESLSLGEREREKGRDSEKTPLEQAKDAVILSCLSTPVPAACLAPALRSAAPEATVAVRILRSATPSAAIPGPAALEKGRIGSVTCLSLRDEDSRDFLCLRRFSFWFVDIHVHGSTMVSDTSALTQLAVWNRAPDDGHSASTCAVARGWQQLPAVFHNMGSAALQWPTKDKLL